MFRFLKNLFGKKESTMTLEQARKLWSEFEIIEPSYILPKKYGYDSNDIPKFIGTIYAGLYDKIKTLLEFNLFQSYASSIMQNQFQSGTLSMFTFRSEI